MNPGSSQFRSVAVRISSVILGIAVTLHSPAADEANPVIPMIQMQTVPLRDAIKNLARQSQLNYILDHRTPATPVTIQWENMTAHAALMRLLKEHDLVLVENPATTVSRITGTNQAANPVNAAWIAGDTNGVIPLIQMEFVPLDLAIRQLAANARLDVMLDTGAANSSAPQGASSSATMVSIRLEKVTARQAIAALCENYDLTLSVDAATGKVRILPAAHRQALEKETPKS